MANVLDTKTRAQILSMLVEGASMRSVSRITGVSINTVSKLLIDAGNACAEYHDNTVRDVAAKRVQCDEIWSLSFASRSFLASRQKRRQVNSPKHGGQAKDVDRKLLEGDVHHNQPDEKGYADCELDALKGPSGFIAHWLAPAAASEPVQRDRRLP
jgi:lambda repressor-like predicted transcriptional regulator